MRWVLGIFTMIGMLLLVGGQYVLWVRAPYAQAEVYRVSTLPARNWDDCLSQPDGSELVLTGTLTDNNRLQDTILGSDHAYVAYKLQRFEIDEDDEGDRSGNWRLSDQVIPMLKMAYGPQQINLVPPPDVGDVRFDGDMQIIRIDAPQQRYGTQYGGEYIYEGEQRILGLRNNDTVTVQGIRQTETTFSLVHLHSGDRQSFLAARQADADDLRVFGWVLTIIGGVMIVFVVFFVTIMRLTTRR